MGQEIGRIITDPIARVLTSFNEQCFGTGCECDSGCSKCCTLHIATGAIANAHESLEKEETENVELHDGEHSSE